MEIGTIGDDTFCEKWLTENSEFECQDDRPDLVHVLGIIHPLPMKIANAIARPYRLGEGSICHTGTMMKTNTSGRGMVKLGSRRRAGDGTRATIASRTRIIRAVSHRESRWGQIPISTHNPGGGKVIRAKSRTTNSESA